MGKMRFATSSLMKGYPDKGKQPPPRLVQALVSQSCADQTLSHARRVGSATVIFYLASGVFFS